MDESSARLSSSLDRLAVVIGDALAPNTIAAMDALAGLIGVMGTAAEAGGGLLQVLTPPGLAGMMFQYATATDGAAESTRAISERWRTAKADADAYAQSVSEAMFAEEELRRTREDPGYIAAPERRPGMTREEAQRRREAVQRAREEAAKVAAATKAVQDKWRQDAFADAVAEDEDRARLAEAGAARLEALAAEEAEAHQRKMERLREEREMIRAVQAARVDAAAAAVSAAAQVADIVAQNSRAAALLGLGEVTVNAGIAISRALAEGGPFAGPALAAAVAGQLAPVIASVKAVVGGGGPNMATVGAGGGGAGGGGRGQVDYGFTVRDSGGNQIMIAEYRGEIYDAQSYDALRRPGSPLRDISRRQRVTR